MSKHQTSLSPVNMSYHIQKRLSLNGLHSPLSKVLPQVSLKESGKSRADLWQLAANTAIDIAVADANLACDDPGLITVAYCMDQQYRVH